MPSANRRRNLALILTALITAAVAIVPSAWFQISDARARRDELTSIAEIVANDRTRLMRSLMLSIDSSAATLAKTLADEFVEGGAVIDSWHERLIKITASNPSVYDVIIAESDGVVLASGRLDAPISIEPLLSPLKGGCTKGGVKRLPSYISYPYEGGVLPYAVGAVSDGSGSCRYAMVVLVDVAGIRQIASDIRIDSAIDLTLTDSDGRILFRFPDSNADLMPGDKVSPVMWKLMISQSELGTVRMMTSDGEERSVCTTLINDERGDMIYAVTSSFSTDVLVSRLGSGSAIDPAYDPMPILIASAIGAVAVGVLMMRRLVLDIALAPSSRVKNIMDVASLDGKAIFDRDILTNTLGKRKGMEVIDEMLSGEDAADIPMALLYGDIDCLREINSVSGSSVGDLVLSETASVFRHVSPQDAVICRYGGDEFAVALPGMDRAAAEGVRDRIRSSLASLRLPEVHGDIRMKFGIAVRRPGSKTSAKELVEEAVAEIRSTKGMQLVSE